MPRSKLTDTLAQELAEALKGLPIRLACDLCDVDEATYYRWLDRGAAGEEPYAAFAALARESRAGYARELLGRVADAGKPLEVSVDPQAGGRFSRPDRGDWKATAWYLERVWPECFAPKSERTHTHKGTVRHDHTIDVTTLSDAELEALARGDDDALGPREAEGQGGA